MRPSSGTLFTLVLLGSLGFLLGEVQREKLKPSEAVACSVLQKRSRFSACVQLKLCFPG